MFWSPRVGPEKHSKFCGPPYFLAFLHLQARIPVHNISEKDMSMEQWNIRRVNVCHLSTSVTTKLKWHICIFGWKQLVSQITHRCIERNENIFSFDIICAHVEVKKMLPNKLKHTVYNKCTILCVCCRVTKYLKTM